MATRGSGSRRVATTPRAGRGGGRRHSAYAGAAGSAAHTVAAHVGGAGAGGPAERLGPGGRRPPIPRRAGSPAHLRVALRLR